MNLLQFFKSDIDSILHLIYPKSCLICLEEIINDRINEICPFCENQLSYTYFEKFTEPTTLDKLFWGRVEVQATFALLFFEKEKSTQQILHALKYEFNTRIGIQFGKKLGLQMKQMSQFVDVDAIIPVPIHPKKEFVRGYNQSEQLAKGLSEVLNIPINKSLISKRINTISQTKLGRFKRWDNVLEIFLVSPKINKIPKHLVIIDDVITTGSTIESMIRSIHQVYPEIRISIVSLAFALR